MYNINAILLIFSFIVSTLIVERTMNIFFGKRRTSTVVFALSYLFFLFALMIHLGEIWDVLLHFTALAVISLNYESVAIKRIAAVAGGHYVLIALTDINSFLILFLPDNWVVDAQILAVMLTSLFIYLVSLTIFPLFKHIKNPVINLNKMWLPLIIFPILHTLISLLRHINPPAFSMIIVTFVNLGVILTVFCLYNIVSKVIEDTLKSSLHSQEKEYYFAQCRLMQKSVENTKSIRHDMHLHLATARDFIVNNKSDEANNYLSSLIGDITKSEIYSNTKNIAFDSIINFKLNNAMHENIKLDLRLLIPPSLNIEVADVVIIVGNLLENALEAVSKVEEKLIKLDIEYSRGSLFIQIENTFDGVIKYAEGTEENRIDPPIEVCLANSNHPPKRGDCDTSGAERINWC
ncbi:MAG: GHKL domain-containing protein, partial [Defluviitaleaceae bacterium]|nr:GHKL domain-containing protein [Defluviitaleaceae bacterium]